jgi:uncharacterized membrane protein (DUF2068 family)
MAPDRKHDATLVLIAALKAVKSLLLIAVGLAAVGAFHVGVGAASQRLLSMFSSGTDRRVTQTVIAHLSGLSPRRIEALGIGAFAYATLFGVEAVGLWLERRWAQYLTVIATISFIPFEIYELVREVTPARIIALVVNVAVAVYLVVRLWRTRKR